MTSLVLNVKLTKQSNQQLRNDAINVSFYSAHNMIRKEDINVSFYTSEKCRKGFDVNDSAVYCNE